VRDLGVVGLESRLVVLLAKALEHRLADHRENTFPVADNNKAQRKADFPGLESD